MRECESEEELWRGRENITNPTVSVNQNGHGDVEKENHNDHLVRKSHMQHRVRWEETQTDTGKRRRPEARHLGWRRHNVAPVINGAQHALTFCNCRSRLEVTI